MVDCNPGAQFNTGAFTLWIGPMSTDVESQTIAKLTTSKEFATRRETAEANNLQKRQKESQALLALEKRLEGLEKETKFGYIAFLMIGDLCNNVIHNGGITKEIVENTLQEIIDYFKMHSDSPDQLEVKLIEAIRAGQI